MCTPKTVAAQPGPPTTTQAASAVTQSAQVLSLVAETAAIRVTDAQGVITPGISATFRVVVGGGQIEGVATVPTDTQGIARLSGWRLGGNVGTNTVIGEVPGLAPVTFTATGSPDGRGSFEITAGEYQAAAGGTALPQDVFVRLRTQASAPIAGRSVRCTLPDGGALPTGTAPIITDSAGEARIRWTLGPNSGEQRLVISPDSFLDRTVTAQSVFAGEPTLAREVVLSNLRRPWDLAFASDGTLFYTLRGGTLAVRLPNGTQHTILSSIPDLNAQDQSGLLGIALDPAFATNRFLYMYLSSNRGGGMDNRVRKYRVSADSRSVTEIGDILTGITWGASGGHSGGRIRFGQDGYLYITSGDTRTATVPQNRTVLGARVLRITTNGEPAPGNPSLGTGTRPQNFAWGFRNPQGLAVQPSTGRVFTYKHGPNQDDEVTWITAGGNGGWDPNDGAGNYNGYSGAVEVPPLMHHLPTNHRPKPLLPHSQPCFVLAQHLFSKGAGEA